MSARIDDRLDVARTILDALEREPARWTPLTRLALKHTTPWKAQAALEWLLRKGYVERPLRGVYEITERGTHLLRVLRP
ncbi:hypothetical protein H8E65_03350 [Candidatus Bathyarchaeota archaeon]|nr:hypothetical protein [Candidatus Bathyarchaeota archaeon]MBL7080646.1 hypothetical protein [Candidatus Bathyarchaeota archaeon]